MANQQSDNPQGRPSANPLENPLYDPFAPEMVIADTPQGPVIDILSTAKNYGEAMLPEVKSQNLLPDDRLIIDFDDETQGEYTVTKVGARSLAFGSDEITSPNLHYTDQEGNLFQLSGSAISPAGTMLSPGTIKQGYHLVSLNQGVGLQVSRGVISDFTVQRKDVTTGEYQEVPPNRLTQTQAEVSAEFAANQAKFSQIRELLESTGFNFDAKDESSVDYPVFLAHTSDQLVYAARQGFGCAVTPMYEIYTYDARDNLLRAMRHMPEEGVTQIAVMPLSPAELVASGIADSRGQLDDVQYLDPSNLHRAKNNSPFFTYTWQTPGQESPLITINAHGHRLDEQILGPEAAGRQNLNYAPVEVNVSVGADQTIEAEAVNPQYWLEADRYRQIVTENTTVTAVDQDIILCKIGAMNVFLPKSPAAEVDAMTAIVKELV